MNVESVHVSRDIIIEPAGDRWYRIPGAFTVDFTLTDEGVVRYCVDDGFLFDGRSGGPLVDFLTPNLGTQDELKCYLVHDLNAYDVYFTYEQTNEILYQMLRKIGYSWYKARLIYTGVNWSRSWFGYPLPSDREYPNLSKIHVRHVAKQQELK